MKLTGSEVLAEVLLEHGVDTVFGYPGGAALNIYDVLYKYSDKIKHVLTAHEQGAAHAADGYYRATGKTGVVIATSGPGATNLVTGIATAFMDSIPMIAITANVPDNLIGRDSFQEICITGVTLPITKHNFFVNKVEDLAPALRDAFRIANSGRKGPVLVDITKDVTAALTEYEKSEPLLLYKNPVAKEEDIEEVAKLINESEKPVIYFGGGVVAAEALDELNELLSKGDIPATNTLMATGVLGYNNKRRLGMIGMHGTVAANKAIHNADLVLALGTRFSDRVALNPNKFASHAKKIQVDLDMSEINKNVFVHKSVISDVKDFLVKLLPLIEKKSRKEWIDQTLLWRKTPVEDKYYKGDLHPGDIVTTACAMADKEPIIVTDVGQHQMWAAQYLKNVKPIKFLTSGGLGTMGYSYGAAIGAAVGSPDKRVIQFVGDGSFHMCLNEACTAVSQNLPIITIIMNNGVLGMVYQWQTVFYEKRYSQTVLNRKTDFVKLAEAFGLTGFRAETLEEFEDIYEKALKIDGPVWIDCRIEELERVLPMIPNGGTVDDMIIN
ncbi:biosynthetic-type acetolactate synthase large subunit [Anaerofustis stercorihominis]|uniref:Acetolactate synthase n=1 Tax=Anaerofustis stercorihominis TaxID=214853 RepID=A0A3E3DYX2_9FIRM|nr:biosynthetic-type acetolactate synthase large subunit [Anaerofustis stercorihominis]RGD73898.1 biosynthetic-type acetolactate synthase large subunit [Anaerofustis stercorihominis]